MLATLLYGPIFGSGPDFYVKNNMVSVSCTPGNYLKNSLLTRDALCGRDAQPALVIVVV